MYFSSWTSDNGEQGVVPGTNPERGDDLDITKSLIIDASSLAGGLTIDATHPEQDPSTIQVIDSIIGNNTASLSGGGATLRASRGTIEVKNSTISGNVVSNFSSSDGAGGGLSVRATYEIPNDPNQPGVYQPELKTVPVGGADTITVWFDRDIIIGNDALTLSGTAESSQGTYTPNAGNFTSGPQSATWRFDTALPADMMHLTVKGDGPDGVTDTAGNRLDGEWIDDFSGELLGNPKTIFDDQSATFPSGDGTEGGDFVFDFTILPGDANRDNVVGLADLAIMQQHYDPATEQFGGFAFRTGDFNGDGKKTNQEDYVGLFTPNIHRVFVLWGKELQVGDMDTDLDVDFDDIPGWVAALTDQYFATYGHLFAGLDQATVDQIVEQAIGDIDDDGDNDFDDSPLFISLLNNNGWSELFPGSL